jgi:hypothetical protein
MTTAIQRGKVRNPAIATLFGVLTELILYGSMHGTGYLHFKRSASEEITKELGQAGNTQSNQIIDAFLQEKTGTQGFWGYLKYSAQQGVSIGRLGSGGVNLGETGTWIYWLIEFGAIDIMIALIANSAAKKPFCENCDQWYKDKELVGGVNPQVSENFLHLLQSEQFSKAGKLLDPLHGFHSPSWEVSLQRCPSCRVSDLLLTVNAISLDKKGELQAKEVVQGMLSLSQYQKFREAVVENQPQSREQNAGTTEEELRLAQRERSMMLASDRFEPHGLSASEEANLVQQL